MRTWLPPLLLLAVAAALTLSQISALGLGLRTGFVLASAAPVGGVLLAVIARLTGAAWPVTAAPAPLLWSAALGVIAMASATGAPLPPHLALWSNPLATAFRAVATLGALAWAAARLRDEANATFAGVTLALYAWLVTPLAADWLLPAAPGQPVSAAGMMLFLMQFSAGCAAALLRAEGRSRRDLSLLLVAALLGLCYLCFVDYLIVWFGNLPARVPFYLDRSGLLAAVAMIVGFGGTATMVIARRYQAATGTAAAGLALFATWWIGDGLVAALVGVAVAIASWALREQARA